VIESGADPYLAGRQFRCQFPASGCGHDSTGVTSVALS
jgi:hypothetical protein